MKPQKPRNECEGYLVKHEKVYFDCNECPLCEILDTAKRIRGKYDSDSELQSYAIRQFLLNLYPTLRVEQ